MPYFNAKTLGESGWKNLRLTLYLAAFLLVCYVTAVLLLAPPAGAQPQVSDSAHETRWQTGGSARISGYTQPGGDAVGGATATSTTAPSSTPTCAPLQTWNVVASQDPGTQENFLLSVEAVAPNYVWAVGYYSNIASGGIAQTLIERWDGAQWTVVPSPNIGISHNYLRGITAISATDAWAVGFYRNVGNNRFQSLAMHWDGTQWNLVVTPNHLNSIGDYPADVDAVSANDIWAVGDWDDGDTNQLLIMHYDGSQWSVIQEPFVSQAYNLLAGVKALASNNVWAVGTRYSGNFDYPIEGLAIHWNGSSWSQVPIATIPQTNTRFEQIDAVSGSDMWAVGWAYAGLSNSTLIEHWDGTAWTIVNSPSPGTLSNVLLGVSALAANNAWAVGYYDNGSGARTLVMHWDGSQWSVAPSPNVGTGQNRLQDVEGIAGADVWSAGYYGPMNATHTLIERYQYSSLCATPGPTDTPVATNTPTPTATSTRTPTNAPTATATRTSTSTSTSTSTPTSTSTNTSTATSTATSTSTETATSTSVPPTACPLYFTDVAVNNTFYPFIRCLACRQIVSGYPCGGPGEPCDDQNNPYFRPNASVTRGQIAKIVSNSAGFDEDPNPQIYEDVAPSNPFYPWVNRLSRRGHMSGYPCGGPGEPCIPPDDRPYFRPFNTATRSQLAKIVSNAAGFGDTGAEQIFTDVPPSNVFYVWVQRLASRGIMGGYPCGGEGEPCDDQQRPYFRPFNTVTRGQTSKIVAGAFFPNCQTPAR